MMIREIKADEIEKIIALDRDIFGRYGGEESPEIIRARIKIFPTGCAVSLIEDQQNGHQIAGYFTTEKWPDLREPALDQHPAKTHDPQGTVLNITTLAITDQFQGAGLGGKLLKRIEEIAAREGCHSVILETAHAERFYTRHGYEKVGERNERGYPLYIMTKQILSA